ncbi:MAG: hypothetical protein ABSE16_19305 [Verrucomicrobiota bacterium]|jgi:hypothetical protein
MTGNGKIARLPRAIRDELNHRMDDGQTGKGFQTLVQKSKGARLPL